MNSNLITIVIATYNAGKYLEICLNSIIPQLNNDIELVIIDGASKDDTIDVIKKHQKYISYWISEKDKGIYDAWNKGIKVATGDWIMFIGADDELLPDAINKYINLLANNDFSSFDYISAQNEYVNEDEKLIKLLGNGADWKLMRKGNSAAHVASLHHKKNLFEKVGFYNLDFKICADYEILLRKKDSLKSYFLQEKIAKMKVGGMSFSVKAIKESYEIRKLHKTIIPLLNNLLFLRDYFAYKLFKIRKFV
ncbi:glycosyltransferase involved in cell wall biosynthesis [Flavobacterium sp. 1]|uniref:glycosyltransferase family 2 protein n=1 Tax=Flavobacterium sp. 1 TaxID=2035200 RepID=UPI000C24A203|nr:glycosyltransferase family 2 protein [Flavobacterium sp. 1]PJJ11115.1 glycosyltransferase involved in cell wall biosynthesis [Flavobacterium sp. 1]